MNSSGGKISRYITPARTLLRALGSGGVRHTRDALLREITRGIDAAEILAPVGVHDDRSAHRRRRFAFPEEELFSIALEGDFYEMIHTLKLRSGDGGRATESGRDG